MRSALNKAASCRQARQRLDREPHGAGRAAFLRDMEKRRYRYLFGPVASRRFGRSLGVDLLCERCCSFDCVFCEVGPTEVSCLERREYVPTGAVIAEIKDWLAGGGSADVITLAGMGEPTLHTGFGAVIDAVHEACSIPVVLLTNSTLFGDPDVRASASRADIVKASLSVWDDASLAAVNRPAEGVTFSNLLEGLQAFRAMYTGRFWLEVILIQGLNDAVSQVRRIAAFASALHPEKIQLNTVVRPPAFPSVAVDPGVLQELAGLFVPSAEVIASVRETVPEPEDGKVEAAALVSMLSRRPGTVADMAAATGIPAGKIHAIAEKLVAGGQLCRLDKNGDGYYGVQPGACVDDKLVG